jgi:S-DNA-T family DNA segregation ATPase FtsK/SpoIIIE
LWERRRADADLLRLRIGLADLSPRTSFREPSTPDPAGSVEDDADEPATPDVLTDVPVTLDLPTLGVLGITGEREVAGAVSGWLIAQTAILHAPGDVRVVVLTGRDDSARKRWNWVRWLPHARIDNDSDDDGVAVAIGTDTESIGRRLAELSALIAERARRETETLPRSRAANSDRPGPAVVVVLDGARRLRALPAVVALLRDGPPVGVYAVCLDDDQARLPEECAAVIACTPARLQLQRSGHDLIDAVRPDLVDAAWLDKTSRALAPIRDITPDEDTGLPGSARLLELLGLDPPTPEAIGRRWAGGMSIVATTAAKADATAHATAGATTRVVIGAGFDGPFSIDLRADGPHTLIAGTTGAGKSELLQTLVASLATVNRPDELTFVLIDYKGGAAFAQCARLPHTVGLVTDLDTHLVERALTSLTAELKRREQLLAAASAKDLEDYQAAGARRSDLSSIPRLVLVIDEFASLVSELPEFVSGLVGIAQRGRSLGVHLVLATQRPSGVVSAEIRANTTLRICLRVGDDADSRDVIDAVDAARIARTTPGRALVRTGHSTLLPFQTGRIGGRRPGAAAARDGGPLIWPHGWDVIGHPAPHRPAHARSAGGDGGGDGDGAGTDLSDLVTAIVRGTRTVLAGAAPVASPWLPPLPDVVPLASLAARTSEPGASNNGDNGAGLAERPIGWALDDLPTEQAQRARRFTLGASGHLFVIGGPGSGRSTALRTLTAVLAEHVPTIDLHVYGLDCGNGALHPLAALPHTGVIVPRTATDRADRLIRRLVEEVSRRQDLLAAYGHASIVEQRANAPAHQQLPYLVFALDRWEGFLTGLGELDGARLLDDVLQLLREGASAGLHVLISGDRSLLSGRIATLVEHKLILRLPERGDYSLAGLPPRAVPTAMPPGRGLWADNGIETHVAVLGAAGSGPDPRHGGPAHATSDLTGAGQAAAIRDLAAWASARDSETPTAMRPFRLAVLPARIAAVEALAGWKPTGPLHLPFGIGGDELDVHALDLSAAPVAVVAGGPRTGRTSTLRLLATHAHAAGTPVIAFSPRPDSFAGHPILDEPGFPADYPPALGNVVFSGIAPNVEAVATHLRALEPNSLILIDDGDLLREGPLAPVLTAVIRQAREKRWGVVVAADTAQFISGLTGWLAETRRHRQGLLLTPQHLADGDALAIRLRRSDVSTRTHPGRGLLTSPGTSPVLIQVPTTP